MATQEGAADRTAALDALFAPTSIAVFGGSDEPGSPAGTLTRNLLDGEFRGAIYPVSARKPSVAGIPTTASVDALPDGVDLVVIGVPARAVPDVVVACGERGIKAALVLSSGFGEVGNRELQGRLEAAAASTGMRINGPNCSGYLNMTDQVNANIATWTPALPLPNAGNMAIVSQSGGFATFIMRRAISLGLGFNYLVTTGNEVDVCVSTAIEYMVGRPDVDVVLAFAESIKDGERFVAAAEMANELDKAVVVLKAGRSEASERAALSHTASIAGSAPAFDAVCRQYCVHIAATVDDLLDLATVLTCKRRAAGPRVGVLTYSGGSGVVLADALSLAGLEVPELPTEDRSKLAKVLPEQFLGSLANPVDLSMQAGVVANPYQLTLECLAESTVTDALAPVVYHYAPPMVEGVRSVFRSSDKPMVVLSTDSFSDPEPGDPPVFTDPRRAARGLAALVRQSNRKSNGPATRLSQDSLEIVNRALDRPRKGSVLMESDAMGILSALGVPYPDSELVSTPHDAAAAFDKLGGVAVAVKVMSYDIPHKTEFGGVRLGLTSANDVMEASDEMLAEVRGRVPGADIAGLLVQTMVPARLELTCGFHRDSVFGPMVVVGIGGTMIEMLAEIVMLRAPFGEATARDGISSLMQGRIVSDRRGLTQPELDQMVHIAQALAELGLLRTDVESVDLNPLRVHDNRVVATDALIVLAEGSPDA